MRNVFFLPDLDQKKLVSQIHPKARQVGVTEELRGWSWHKPPLKPYYDDTRIPMYAACSKYCPTRRDSYVGLVKGLRGTPTPKMSLGSAVHETVRTALTAFIDGERLDFDEWYNKALTIKGVASASLDIKEKAREAYELTNASAISRFSEAQSKQPYSTRRDLMATALPFLVEHRITGELLGLSGLLRVDCYDYLHGIVFDIKVSAEKRDWYRLYSTGYALVIESVYEVPVDIGCTVYVNYPRGHITVDRDLFFISDDLRSWWIEERDEKLKIVAQKNDPGLPNTCPEDCQYLRECGVSEAQREAGKP